MRKYISYILILVALVGIFSLVPIKQVKADQCVLTGWIYSSCHNNTGAMTGSIYTGTKNTTAGSQETCTTGDTNMSKTSCDGYGGKWYASPNEHPPTTQEGVSVVTSTSAGTTTAGGICTGQDSSGNNTPTGCNATLSASGSSCTISSATLLGSTCTKWRGEYSTSILHPYGTCTGIPNWSPNSCTKDHGGTYYPPGTAPGTVEQKDITTYTLLAPLPNGSGGQMTTFSFKAQYGLSDYLNLMIKIFIGICAVLAVIMIVFGGIQYMTSELISSKEAGKERIRNAIFGLILALGAWTLLNTINPNLLKFDIQISEVAANATISIKDFSASPSTYIVPLGKTGQATGTNCDENVVSTSNQTASAGLNSSQIHTLACIGGIESGCQSVQNYNWNNGSSAYGPFQITLQSNAVCFENSVCRQAAGVSGSLNCAAGFSGGNPISGSPIVAQCKKAADDFTCSVSAAACLIQKKPNYSDWNANPNLSKCL